MSSEEQEEVELKTAKVLEKNLEKEKEHLLLTAAA